MVYDLYSLNDLVNKVATRIVETAAKETSNGTYQVSHDDVATLIDYEDYLAYFEFIVAEVSSRPEVLDVDQMDEQIGCSIDLRYCPNYEWCEGDEAIFEMSREEWEQSFEALPVSHPLSMGRMSEIGQRAIEDTLQNGDMALEILTESLGMSQAEVEQLGVLSKTGPSKSVDQTKGEPPILFYVWNNADDFDAPTKCTSFEEAYDLYEQNSNPQKSITCLIPDEKERGFGLVLMSHDPTFGSSTPFTTQGILEKSPHLMLAYAKARLSLFSFDPYGQSLRDHAEKMLGISDFHPPLSDRLDALKKHSAAPSAKMPAKEGERNI